MSWLPSRIIGTAVPHIAPVNCSKPMCKAACSADIIPPPMLLVQPTTESVKMERDSIIRGTCACVRGHLMQVYFGTVCVCALMPADRWAGGGWRRFSLEGANWTPPRPPASSDTRWDCLCLHLSHTHGHTDSTAISSCGLTTKVFSFSKVTWRSVNLQLPHDTTTQPPDRKLDEPIAGSSCWIWEEAEIKISCLWPHAAWSFVSDGKKILQWP